MFVQGRPDVERESLKAQFHDLEGGAAAMARLEVLELIWKGSKSCWKNHKV